MRIGIVSSGAREALRRTISSRGDHEVLWTAASGPETIERCSRDCPDCIVMDVGALESEYAGTIRQIMASTPCAILVFDSGHGDNTARIFRALGAGALDAVSSTLVDRTGAIRGARVLIQKLDMVSRLVGRPQGKPRSDTTSKHPARGLVAIGASAGGPAAVATVLKSLPGDLSVPIIIVQHVDSQFMQGLAGWLGQQSRFPVFLANEGDRPQPGQVLLAGREEHLVFTSPTRLGYSRAPTEMSYRPSVDVFFKSVNQFWTGKVAAVLLTGMGRDGAEGLRLLRASGHHTITQDRRTSAVYGMPKAAAELDAAAEILALEKIGPRLAALFAGAGAA
jgi:two-component system response regulator WspF